MLQNQTSVNKITTAGFYLGSKNGRKILFLNLKRNRKFILENPIFAPKSLIYLEYRCHVVKSGFCFSRFSISAQIQTFFLNLDVQLWAWDSVLKIMLSRSSISIAFGCLESLDFNLSNICDLCDVSVSLIQKRRTRDAIFWLGRVSPRTLATSQPSKNHFHFLICPLSRLHSIFGNAVDSFFLNYPCAWSLVGTIWSPYSIPHRAIWTSYCLNYACHQRCRCRCHFGYYRFAGFTSSSSNRANFHVTFGSDLAWSSGVQ